MSGLSQTISEHVRLLEDIEVIKEEEIRIEEEIKELSFQVPEATMRLLPFLKAGYPSSVVPGKWGKHRGWVLSDSCSHKLAVDTSGSVWVRTPGPKWKDWMYTFALLCFLSLGIKVGYYIASEDLIESVAVRFISLLSTMIFSMTILFIVLMSLIDGSPLISLMEPYKRLSFVQGNDDFYEQVAGKVDEKLKEAKEEIEAKKIKLKDKRQKLKLLKDKIADDLTHIAG